MGNQMGGRTRERRLGLRNEVCDSLRDCGDLSCLVRGIGDMAVRRGFFKAWAYKNKIDHEQQLSLKYQPIPTNHYNYLPMHYKP